VRRTIASVGANGQAGERLRWDLSLTAARVDDGTAVERNYNAAASLDWQLAPAWTLQLQWYRTRIQTASALAETAFVRDDQVQLVVRYSELFGVPYPRVPGWGGRSGTGRVLGSIYLDENGDGQRQPFERGVPGVVVILDGRQTQVSDREGRFTFPLVPTGRRSITVTLDRVPLPWGLADESPRAVEVPVRGDSRIDIGLDRVGG
jgi:hypothetical protein